MLPLLLIACRPPAAPVPDPPAFHFAVVGDRTGEPDDRAWQAVLAEVEGLHPDLVLTVGDLADDALDDSDWALALAPTRVLTSPIAFTPGNHDIVDAATAEAFAVRTGQAPYRSFDFRGVHFVIVDNAVGERWEDLAQAQRDWLAADLLAHTEQMQVVLMHKPFWALRVARGEPDPMRERPEGDATRVWLRWDDEALYVAAQLDDAHPEALSRVHHERDRHVEYDDRIGLLLAPAPDQVYWFYVNPNGAVWDLHADRAAGAVHREWDAVQAAATVGDAGWAVEARIPFVALGGAPTADAAWRFDLRRKQESVQAESLFTPAFSLTDPARMATMRFGALVHAEGREPAAR